MWASLRRVWPPWPWLLAVVALGGGLMGSMVCVGHSMGLSWPESAAIAAPLLRAVVIPFVFLYGLYRVFAFHPIFWDEYRDWLTRTPWTPDRPLPLGPVHLVWQDALMLAIVAAMAAPFSEAMLVIVVAVFSFAYLGAALGTIVRAEEWPAGYLVAFGLGWMVLLATSPLPLLVAVALTHVAARWGLFRSYRRFPWSNSVWQQMAEETKAGPGWPFSQLRPKRSPPLLPPGRAVLVSLVLSWFFFAVVTRLAAAKAKPDEARTMLLCFAGLFLIVAAAYRMAFYFGDGIVAPISLDGRRATGRWIIPGFDKVFLAPLLGAAFFFGLPPLLRVAGVEPAAGMALGVFAALVALTTVGPSRERWFLTGDHRIAPGGVSENSKDFV